MAERRPFHETIVDAINFVFIQDQMDCLSHLIHGTKIPKNHDAIAEAWLKKCRGFGMGCDPWNVVTALNEQKGEIEAEAAAKEQAAAEAQAMRGCSGHQ